MKTITVKMSDEQADYFRMIAEEITPGRPGDAMLAAAFGYLSMNSKMEGSGETTLYAVREFVGKRSLPDLDVGDIFEYGLTTRPAGAHIAAMQALAAAK